jgi:hypothetical protein
VIGPLALHGGGEFMAGDEPFLRHLLELAAAAARARTRTQAPGGGSGPGSAPGTGPGAIRIELLTTAVARHRPAMAFAVGSAAFERLAPEVTGGAGGGRVLVGHARVVDADTAADPAIAERLAAADLVYLPGGDPDAVVEILAGTLAWQSVRTARLRGAVVAGASAGAMALGEQTWTPRGYVAGFGWAGRLVVVPHADAARLASVRPTVDALPHGQQLAILGLPERAGVSGRPGTWTVIGDAGAWWWPPHASVPGHVPAGGVIRA